MVKKNQQNNFFSFSGNKDYISIVTTSKNRAVKVHSFLMILSLLEGGKV